MQKKGWLDIITYVLVGLALVAILTHATGFAQAVTSIDTFVTGESLILAGGGGTNKAG